MIPCVLSADTWSSTCCLCSNPFPPAHPWWKQAAHGAVGWRAAGGHPEGLLLGVTACWPSATTGFWQIRLTAPLPAFRCDSWPSTGWEEQRERAPSSPCPGRHEGERGRCLCWSHSQGHREARRKGPNKSPCRITASQPNTTGHTIGWYGKRSMERQSEERVCFSSVYFAPSPQDHAVGRKRLRCAMLPLALSHQRLVGTAPRSTEACRSVCEVLRATDLAFYKCICFWFIGEVKEIGCFCRSQKYNHIKAWVKEDDLCSWTSVMWTFSFLPEKTTQILMG